MSETQTILTDEGPFYVVIRQNDKPDPRFGFDPGGPMVEETYLQGATLERARERQRVMEQRGMGMHRIARLVIGAALEDEDTERAYKRGFHTAMDLQREDLHDSIRAAVEAALEGAIRRDALEEAAKLIEDRNPAHNWDPGGVAHECAAAIRALMALTTHCGDLAASLEEGKP